MVDFVESCFFDDEDDDDEDEDDEEEEKERDEEERKREQEEIEETAHIIGEDFHKLLWRFGIPWVMPKVYYDYFTERNMGYRLNVKNKKVFI
jgi:hypothetical protein